MSLYHIRLQRSLFMLFPWLLIACNLWTRAAKSFLLMKLKKTISDDFSAGFFNKLVNYCLNSWFIYSLSTTLYLNISPSSHLSCTLIVSARKPQVICKTTTHPCNCELLLLNYSIIIVHLLCLVVSPLLISLNKQIFELWIKKKLMSIIYFVYFMNK